MTVEGVVRPSVGTYGKIEQAIDGMMILVNSVEIHFRAPSFHSSMQVLGCRLGRLFVEQSFGCHFIPSIAFLHRLIGLKCSVQCPITSIQRI